MWQFVIFKKNFSSSIGKLSVNLEKIEDVCFNSYMRYFRIQECVRGDIFEFSFKNPSIMTCKSFSTYKKFTKWQ